MCSRAQASRPARLLSTLSNELYQTVICRDESRLIARELRNRARRQAPAMPDGLTESRSLRADLTLAADAQATDAANDAAMDLAASPAAAVPGRTLVRTRATRHAPA